MQLPNNIFITPTHQGILHLSNNVLKHAQTGTIIPKLRSASLLSMKKLCNDVKQKFTEENFSIPNIHPSTYGPRKIARVEDKHNFGPPKKTLPPKMLFANNIDQILKYQRKRDNEAYSVVHINNRKLNIILRKDKTHTKLATFLHAGLFLADDIHILQSN